MDAGLDKALAGFFNVLNSGLPYLTVFFKGIVGVAGGTITAGTNFFVMPGTGGKAYAYDGAGANTQIIAGRFLPNAANTAASANEEVEILVSVSLGV